MKSLALALLLSIVVSASGQTNIETVSTAPGQGIQRPADSLATGMTSPTPQQARKIKIVKKDVHYGSFVALAIGMMGFIALILTLPQTYNPSE